jgi:hypothetical protein
VKRYSGDNSWRVASRKDSSMPGLYYRRRPRLLNKEAGPSSVGIDVFVYFSPSLETGSRLAVKGVVV